jgi:SAM-dependent methyltransferase
MKLSQTRIECGEAVGRFSKIVKSNPPEVKKMLYVGTAGDPEGGEYSPLFRPEFSTSTMDVDPIWKPDIVGDITKSPLQDASVGCVVCVQVLEHVPNIWEAPREIHRILCRGGYAIVDTPFMYPYHAEPPSFGDYWRLTKDGMRQLFGSLFEIVDMIATDNLTSCLLKKS